MRNAYALLGLSFLIVFAGAYLLFEKAEAPYNKADTVNQTTDDMKLTSPNFENDGFIPDIFTCDGENISPELHISSVPEGTVSLVLVMDDPDIPEQIKSTRGIEKFNHWVLYNLPAETTVIKAGEIAGLTGENGRGETSYTGPCPPTEYEPTEHRYIFRLYALSNNLNFIKTPTLDEVEAVAQAEALATAELVGRYDRSQK